MTVSPTHESGCAEFRQSAGFSRRDALRLGGLAGLGLTLPQLLAERGNAKPANSSSTFGRAKRVIMLFLHGGHPQQETFDPKPSGPVAVRGEFGAIATSLTGVRFSELLPRISKRAHKLAVVRSMSHGNPNHVQACLPAQTGHKHPASQKRKGDFPPSETDFPPFGAVLDAVKPAVGKLPTWVRIGPLMRRNNGTVLHGQLPGFLGAKHSHFAVDQKLLGDNIKVQAVQPADDLTSVRLSSRRNLLRQFDRRRKAFDQTAGMQRLDSFYEKAFDLLSSNATRTAFHLAAESSKTRERYGQTEFGQRCLLARRLAEAGVPMVNISYCHTPRGSWDTHSQNFKKMKSSLAPTLDRSFTALIDDLDARGMLDDTLVMINAEFGRTPAINRNAGRDHWPSVYSLVLCGAGIRPGKVYGTSDNSAAYPTDKPHDPADMAATLYHLLGVSAETVLHDKLSRPHHLVIGKPIGGLLA